MLLAINLLKPRRKRTGRTFWLDPPVRIRHQPSLEAPMNPAPNSAAARRRLARGAVLAATTATLVLAASPAFAITDAPSVLHAQPATSPSSSGSSDEKPAVVGPTLDFFGFGAGIGLPLVCQAGTSAIGSGAGAAGVAGQAGPVIGKVNNGCDLASTQGVRFVAKGQQAAKPLNVINPYANNALEAAAGAVEQYGAQYNDTLAPFGPTVRGSGATLRWFEGR
jgi:hypothetical protein